MWEKAIPMSDALKRACKMYIANGFLDIDIERYFGIDRNTARKCRNEMKAEYWDRGRNKR